MENNTKFTPGPWTTIRSASNNLYVLADNGMRILNIAVINDEDTIPEESESNARLIVSAPELFAALVELVEEEDDYIDELWALGDTPASPALARARDVISKVSNPCTIKSDNPTPSTQWNGGWQPVDPLDPPHDITGL
jgi:hypothetical protein